jgi:UDP-glucose 4-epimerase
MRAIVTGGAGFIGSHVADGLLEEGHEVLVLDDLSSGRLENVPRGATLVRGDIRDHELVRRTFSDFRPDVVSHQAAQTSVSVSVREPRRDAEINVLGGLEVLLASIESGVGRFVFASTGGAIYGEVPEGVRAAPGYPLTPISPYACSKLAFENYLAAYGIASGIEYTTLRYANVYGPRQDPHGEAGVVAIFSQRLLAGEPLRVNARREKGDDGCVRDYVYVGDVVRANLRAARGELSERVVNVCTGEATSTKSLALALAEAFGREPELVHAEKREGDLERSVLEPNPTAFGGEALGLGEGIGRTVDWFRRMTP